MCGIVAEYGASDPAELERMLERIAHRGPDDRGTVQVDGSWLGHRRLSIVDVEGGAQPLRTARADAFLVGNGEVYNHENVRTRLEGREILTTSDNEVALHLLDEYGPEALKRLNGMYAFVMATEDGRFVAARDPVGIKPLYWTPPTRPPGSGGARPGALRERDARVRPRVAALRRAVPAGPLLDAGGRAGALRVRGAGRARPAAARHRPAARHARGARPRGRPPDDGRRPRRRVPLRRPGLQPRRRDRRPLGRARGHRPAHLRGGTDGSPDLLAARTVAEFLGTDHHEIDYRAAEALESLPNVVRAIESFDPGLVRSAVPNYMLARMTRQHVRVVLTGEGADELFAGYEYLREFTEPDALRAELERTVRSLHNLNLQRCDRVTMAHAVEARVPFLDREVIEWALRVPADAKIARPGEPEKRLLREAFDGWLPDELLWREKAEFGDGSGARDVLSAAIEADVSDEAFAAERGAVDPPLRTKEELAYYRVWREHLDGISPERTLSRFARA